MSALEGEATKTVKTSRDADVMVINFLKKVTSAQFLVASGIGSGIKPTFFHPISITAFAEQKDKQDRVLWKF